MTTRSLLFAAVLHVLASGCASKKKAPYREEKRGRDYSSVNKESLQFLFETFRQEPRLRRESAWDWSKLRKENAENSKDSVKFVWSSLTASEKESWKYAWTDLFPSMLKGPDDFWGSVRFGFLDSGD